MQIHDLLEHMVDTGEYRAPEAFDDLHAGIELVRQTTMSRIWADLPDVARANLIRWVKEALDLLSTNER